MSGFEYEEAEPFLFLLAQATRGWGRIHAVQRLAQTGDDEIRQWLVRDGFRNEFEDEILAYTCAVAGDLVGQLREDDPDLELLTGALDILAAMTTEGMSEDLTDYEDGCEACELVLDHAQTRDLPLSAALAVARIASFVSDEETNWFALAGDWPEKRRDRILDLADQFLGRGEWMDLVERGLASSDDDAFLTAVEAAYLFQIDVWQILFDKQADDPEGEFWTYLMQTDDPGRIDEVIALGETVLAVSTQKADPTDFDADDDELPGEMAHGLIVAELGVWPGRGWSLVRAALEHPDMGHRFRATGVLRDWGRKNWPDGAVEALRAAHERETDDEELRARYTALLNDLPFTD